MLDGPAVAAALDACGVTHVVWIPDSVLGTWDAALSSSQSLRLIRPTREGEAVGIALGLWLGGARPVVAIQSTGLFEAGDALRNAVHDIGMPLTLMVGVRGELARRAGRGNDSCAVFAEPILQAWAMPFTWLDPSASGDDLVAALRNVQNSGGPGAVLVAE